MLKTRFTSTAFTSVAPETELDLNTLSNLKALKPPSSLNLDKQSNLLLITANGACVNEINLNGDGVTTETALHLVQTLSFNQCNVEHNRNKIVGCLAGGGFSLKASNRIISAETASQLRSPFNVVAQIVVWRDLNDKLSSLLIDSADPASKTFKTISLSWEYSFDQYSILISEDGTVGNGEIIRPNSHLYGELDSKLKASGGDGQYHGYQLGRLIDEGANMGMVSGFAFTRNPAATFDPTGTGLVALGFSDAAKATELKRLKARLRRIQQPSFSDQMEAFRMSAS